MPIELYSYNFYASCRAVLMTAKQLNIDLDVKQVDLSEGEHRKPEILKLNPGHTLPILKENSFVLWESRAIMAYLCNQYAPDSSLYPKEPKKRAIVDRWLDFDMSLFNTQRDIISSRLISGTEPAEDKVNAHKNNLKLADQLIGDNKYLTGNQLTIADLSVLATTVLPHVFGRDFKEYPNLERWYTTVSQSLPYFNEINKMSKDEVKALMEKIKVRIAQRKAQ